MIKVPLLGIALLVAVSLPAIAQDAMKKNTPVKPADPELKVVVNSWNDIGRKLIAMAEDFPEDKYDYKPTPAQRSFAEQLLHAAGANYYFTNPVMGQKPPAFDAKKRIVGRVRLTQIGGVVAAPPVGIDSECESLAAVTWYDSFPLTTRAPPARSQPFAPFSNEPPCMSEYDAPSAQRMNGWIAGG